MRCSASAPTSGCPTTRRRLGCTPRPGCSTGIGLLDRVHRLSNLTHSAQVTGLEWNVRVVRRAQPRRDREDRRRLRVLLGERRLRALRPRRVRCAADADGRRGPSVLLQSDRAAPRAVPGAPARADRSCRAQRGHHRNLLVSATGTGKTVMAAVDYARAAADAAPSAAALRRPPRRRSSSRAGRRSATPCAMPRSASCGSAGMRPQRFEHVFASIQSLDVADLEPTSRPITSTSSSSTSSITPPRPRTSACSTTSRPSSCSA